MKTKEAAQVLSALSQQARLNIVQSLVAVGPSGMSAGAISQSLGIPPATLSFHLKELRNTDIIERRREGRSLIYSPNFETVNQLLTFLNERCCKKTTD
jgi:DNA-binding transcriptional ArsR family regulator